MVGLAHDQLTDTLSGMLRQSIAHSIGIKVTSHIYDATFRYRYVTESGLKHLKHGMQHVLHRLRTLGELVETHDGRSPLVNAEAGIGVIPSHLALMVDHRHAHVTKVKVGYVYHAQW